MKENNRADNGHDLYADAAKQFFVNLVAVQKKQYPMLIFAYGSSSEAPGGNGILLKSFPSLYFMLSGFLSS
jgi:hypothetical protein